jgi:hypothetical protein
VRLRIAAAAAALIAASSVTSLGRPREARADQLQSLGEGLIYVIPTGGSVFTGAVNGLYLAAGEGAPRRWRVSAWILGGAALLVGGYVLWDTGADTAGDITLGAVPIVFGAGAVLTATFVGAPDDIVGDMSLVQPLWVAGESGRLELAGVALGGRF